MQNRFFPCQWKILFSRESKKFALRFFMIQSPIERFFFLAIWFFLTKLNYTLSHSPLRQKRLIYEWSTIGSMIQEEQCPTWINKKDKRRDDNRGNKQRQFQSANRTLLFAPSSSVYLAWFFLSPSLFCLDPFPLSLTARRRRKQLGTGSRAENIDVP